MTGKSMTSAFCCIKSSCKHFIVVRIKNIVEARSLRVPNFKVFGHLKFSF